MNIKNRFLVVLSIILSAELSAQQRPEVKWTLIDSISVPVPPAEHPRLFLTSMDVPDLKKRVSHPGLKQVWEELQEQAGKNVQIQIEVDAAKFLMTGDKELGLRTLELALKTLEKAEYDLTVQDVTRPIGRMMVTGAIAYDWCYPLLTALQKKAFQDQLFRLAKQLECGYPPKHGWVTGHGSEWMVMRDMLSAGIAIYDEIPEMYQHAAKTFFAFLLPARNFWYPGHAFHQGTAYAETRFVSDLYPLWIFDRMGFSNVYDPAQQFVPYQWIYLRRPDNQLLRAGDGQGKEPKLRSLLCASYYKDGYVMSDYLKNPGIDDMNKLFQLLWSDPDLKPLPVTDLPLTRYMDFPYGWMVARTGWDENSVIAEMKVNIFNFNNHQHHDAGAFQIYYKGPLALDAGLYQGTSGGYSSPHNKNYAHRTIAHNSLLIYDSQEQFNTRGDYGNDGGQRLPNNRREPGTLQILLDPANGYQTGKVEASGFGPDLKIPDYSYLKGDITLAYSKKVKEVKRSFVFLNLNNERVPAALIVFDKIVSSNPEFGKYWLLHSMEEPLVDRNITSVTLNERGWSGKLVNTTLLPEYVNAIINKVGGAGKEYWVFGKNYENELQGSANPINFETGRWRIELQPRQSTTEDYFLNIMQVTDKDNMQVYQAERIDGVNFTGVIFSDRMVIFSKTSDIIDSSFSLRVPQGRTYKILLTDLLPGTWQVRKDGNPYIPAILVRSGEGTIYLEGTGGEYTFLR
jgi:heparin/heparan-sulfate lyase